MKCRYHTKLQSSDKTKVCCFSQEGMILAIYSDHRKLIPLLYQILHVQMPFARKLLMLFQTLGVIMGICSALQSAKAYSCSQIKTEFIRRIWHRLMGFYQTLVRQSRLNLQIQKPRLEILLSTVAQTQISNAILIGMPWLMGQSFCRKIWLNLSVALDIKTKKAATS